MMTSSNGNIFRVTGHLCGEFTGPRWIPLTKAGDAELWCFFHLRPNKRLSKQWWGWWFETPSRPLWCHCNVYEVLSCFALWRLYHQFSCGFVWCVYPYHYSDVIIGAMASQITSITIVYSTAYSYADPINHQSSASLAFVRGIHRWPVNSPHKWPVKRKCFHLMMSSWLFRVGCTKAPYFNFCVMDIHNVTMYVNSFQSRPYLAGVAAAQRKID